MSVPTDFDLSKCERIGSGSFSTVYFWEDPCKIQDLAIKHIVRKIDDADDSIEKAKKEFDLLIKLDHDHIVKVFDFQIRHDCFLIIMEYMPGGTLRNLIRCQPTRCLSEEQTICFGRQLLQAVEYTHNLNIVHRDIKSENIFLDATRTSLKLGDFGCGMKLMSARSHTELNSLRGTCHYMAPEVIKANYGTKADIWSAGVVIFEMLSGKPPGYGLDPLQIMYNVMNGDLEYELPDNASRAIRNLITQLRAFEPAQRPTAGQALAQKIFLPRYIAIKQHHAESLEVPKGNGNDIMNNAIELKLEIFEADDPMNDDTEDGEGQAISRQYEECLEHQGKPAFIFGTDAAAHLCIMDAKGIPRPTNPDLCRFSQLSPMFAVWRYIYHIPDFRVILFFVDQFKSAPNFVFPLVKRVNIMALMQQLEKHMLEDLFGEKNEQKDMDDSWGDKISVQGCRCKCEAHSCKAK